MIKNWAEFQGAENKTRPNSPYVSLNAKGIILMNKLAHQLMGGPEAVTLLYDRVNGLIGLRPAAVDLPNAFRLGSKFAGKFRKICARPFFKHHRIETCRTVAFNDIEVDHEGVMVLDLANVTAVGSAVKPDAASRPPLLKIG